MELRFIDPIADEQWDQVVSSLAGAQIFHRSSWARVLCATYGHRPHYAEARWGDERVALVPLMEVRSRLTGVRGVSLPFSDCCPPLWTAQPETGIITPVIELGRSLGWRYVEFRGGLGASGGAEAASGRFYTHELPLAPAEDQFASCTSAARRAIRKAQKSDLRVEFSTSLTGVRQYYALHERTRRKHGAPPQPFAFFANLHAYLLAKGAGFVALAFQQQQPVAGALFLHAGLHGTYKFAASDERYSGLRGSNLVIWEATRKLWDLGCRSLHFGRTSLSNEGLRHFKRGWGSRESVLSYHRYSTADGQLVAAPDRAGGWAAKFFKKLPLGLNRIAGKLLYNHLD